MTDLPSSWITAEIADLVELQETGKPFQQGWSPQCERRPAEDNEWGVVKTTAIQHGEFWSHENKALPEKLDPRPQIEIKPGDVLMTCAGPRNRCGVACLVKKTRSRLMMSGKMYRFRPHPELLDPQFLSRFIRLHETQQRIDAMKTGINDSGLNLTHARFGKLPVVVPPTNEQRRIVEKIEAMFDEIDKGVESLQTARATLGLYRQSLLKSAFEGRLTANWRAQNADKLEAPETLLARIQSERDTRYKTALDAWQEALAKWHADGEKGKKPAKPKRPAWPTKFDYSDLRDLPKGWVYLPFEALAWAIRNGISAKPDEKGPFKIFRISAVRPMAFDLEDFRRITDPDGSFENYCLSYGDLVFTRYNGSRDYVGVSAMYRGDGSHVYPDKLIRCEIRSDILNPAYLEAATNCGQSRAYIERRIRTTAGQSGVSGGDIKATPVPICSPAEQAEIVQLLDAQLEAAARLEAEVDSALTRADALRQSILKKAFSGQLVPQDPEDEPASALLARIKTDRAKTPKARRKRVSKKQKEAQHGL
ncbi:restriction endonuclease subunit S [Meridianimarinicoccus sp. MJW13]|uniref:restriction endonuclease subunit S n=1 Tax=Meridianimarinicoccus sp. MJW13 TaxID=2720031 RepID=UPI001868B39E|nr:restriction endonuclease subunit S [Fluviibacterium sp. MJW13]